MIQPPAKMDWTSFCTGGIGDNSFIQLTGVDFERATPKSQLALLAERFASLGDVGQMASELSRDPKAIQQQVESMKDSLSESLQEMPFTEMLDESLRGVPLYSTGHSSGSSLQQQPFSGKVSLSRNRETLKKAAQQIDEQGSLKGYVRIDSSDEARQMIPLLSDLSVLKDPSTLRQTIAQLGVKNGATDVKYVIEPMQESPNRAYYVGVLVASVLSIAIGLVICGSGATRWWTWLLLPIPALIGLLGFPLRSGRGGHRTRLIYWFIGFSLLALGILELIVLGRFGQTGANALHQTTGFLATAVGLAALIGASLHLRYRGSVLSTLPPPPPRTVQSSRSIVSYRRSDISDQAADELAFSANSTMDYQDPRFTASMDDACSSIMMECIERFAMLGFHTPSFMRASDERGETTIALVFGCDHTVLAEISDNGRKPMIRLISMLQDGLSVITVSESVCQAKEKKFGTHGVYFSGPSGEAKTLLTAHLQQAIRMSEKRGANVETFDHEEKLEACLHARRVFADIQRELGQKQVGVGPATYGRFAFPPQRLVQLV